MTTFKDFKEAVSLQLLTMQEHELFVSNATRDDLWNTYLSSFPVGTNPMFRERTEHDCNCCKQFIRSAGNALAIIDGDLVSAWDINVGGHYQVVADALSTLVRSNPIKNKYLHFEEHLGTDHNHQQLEDGGIKTWEHFHHKLAPAYVANQDRIDSENARR